VPIQRGELDPQRHDEQYWPIELLRQDFRPLHPDGTLITIVGVEVGGEPQDVNDPGTIVVGVDESESAQQVLRYALAEGERRSAAVRAVTVLPPPSRWGIMEAESDSVSPLYSPLAQDALRADIEQRLRALADDVRKEDPAFTRVAVTVEVLQGHPGHVLVEQARKADLLVVGHHGQTFASGFGSVALACVLHATVPVTVVRPVAR
jgi:nucleotide-binding universal stress UspA family protein